MPQVVHTEGVLGYILMRKYILLNINIAQKETRNDSLRALIFFHGK